MWSSLTSTPARRPFLLGLGSTGRYTPRPRTPEEWSVAQFSREAEELLQELGDKVSESVQKTADVDVEFSQGVLSLKFFNGVFVLNTQTPNRQIWLSSPISGPARYYYDVESGRWRNTRDNHLLEDRLRQDLRAFTGHDVEIGQLR